MADSLRVAVLSLLDRAIETLNSRQDDAAVHETRKATKLIRAALRLMRGNLGPLAYRRENARVRDAAKPLTAVRDAFMLRQKLRAMPERPVALHRGLDAEYLQERNALKRRGARAAVARFRAIRTQLAALPVVDSELESAVAGLRKTYRAGRNACARAQSRDDQVLHEWRKHARYLLNQLELLRTVFGAEFEKLHRRADPLARILGDDHDLGVLLSKLHRYDANNRSLEHHINKQRRKLQARAQQLGRKLYRHSGKHVANTIAVGLSSAGGSARSAASRQASRTNGAAMTFRNPG